MNPKQMRSPLRIAKGLGSAQSGTEHWILQRLTALALVPLSLYALAGFFQIVLTGGYAGAIAWLGTPIGAVFVLMFLLVGLRHAVLGLEVVIEDYIHKSSDKVALIFFVKFVAGAAALLGTLSLAKIYVGV